MLTRIEIAEIVKEMSENESDAEKKDVLVKAAKLLDGKKHHAIWSDKKYHCPICGRELNPSFQKECPICFIKVVYKKSSEAEK